MRQVVMVRILMGFVPLAGCECLGTTPNEGPCRTGGRAVPDQDQAAWERWLFGTRYHYVPASRPSDFPDVNKSPSALTTALSEHEK
jgi:hypothetical protein